MCFGAESYQKTVSKTSVLETPESAVFFKIFKGICFTCTTMESF